VRSADSGLGAHLASHLLPRAGSRVVIVAGLVLMAGGALLLTAVSARSEYLAGLLPGLLVIGLGTGLALPATAVIGLNEIGEDRAGTASGLMSAAHEIGAAFGVAVFSAVAVVASGGISAGYRHGFDVAAVIAVALALLAAVTVPAVRPAPDARVAVH
jgi:MFS family permease